MIEVPPELDWGPKKLRDWLRQLLTFCIKSRIVNVVGGNLDEVDNGQVLAVSGTRGASATQANPFDVTGAVANGVVELSIYPGTVNEILPRNIFDSVSCSPNGMFYVKLGVETDGKSVTGASIYTDSSAVAVNPATENYAPDFFEVILAIVDNGRIYQVRNGPLSFKAVIALVVSRVPPGPGEEPYTRWWRWGA